jgi:5'-nucleotidase
MMTEPRIVLIDMDETIVDFARGFAAIWARRYPTIPNPYHLAKREHLRHDRMPEEVRDRVWTIFTTPGFFRNLPPFPGVPRAMGEMDKAGLVPFLCTTSLVNNPTCSDDKRAWVKQFLPKFMSSRLAVTDDKTTMLGEWLIDDMPAVHGLLRPRWRHVLFDGPHNRHVRHLPRMTHWGQWENALGV